MAHFLQELLVFNTMISCRQCVWSSPDVQTVGTVLSISCHWLSETPGTGYELETERSQSLLSFVSPLQTIYLIEEIYAKILIHVSNCLYYWLWAG